MILLCEDSLDSYSLCNMNSCPCIWLGVKLSWSMYIHLKICLLGSKRIQLVSSVV